jgi:hypothetical protein
MKTGPKGTLSRLLAQPSSLAQTLNTLAAVLNCHPHQNLKPGTQLGRGYAPMQQRNRQHSCVHLCCCGCSSARRSRRAIASSSIMHAIVGTRHHHMFSCPLHQWGQLYSCVQVQQQVASRLHNGMCCVKKESPTGHSHTRQPATVRNCSHTRVWCQVTSSPPHGNSKPGTTCAG